MWTAIAVAACLATPQHVRVHSRAGSNRVVYLGDSIMAGNHLNSPTTQGIPALVADAMPQLAGHASNLAIGSTHANEDGTHTDGGQGATADGLYSASLQLNVVVILFGANDIAAGYKSTQFEAALKAYALARRSRGFKVVILTTLPNSMITTNGFDSQRTAANAATLADPSFWDAVADIASDPTMGNAANNRDTIYYSDGVHPTPLGNSYLTHYLTAALSLLFGAPTPLVARPHA